jgi:hypothetical protein
MVYYTSASSSLAYSSCRGGVVAAPYFREQFGLLNADGSLNKKKSDNISANVVSVLQAGAFFGSLGSAPLSRKLTTFRLLIVFAIHAGITDIPRFTDKIGRIRTLLIFTVIFCIGAVSEVFNNIISSCSADVSPRS